MLSEREKDGIRYFVSERLDEAPGALHAFSTRVGGVSLPPFSSLNFDGSGADTPENIGRNRELFAAAAGMSQDELKRLVTLNQVHGGKIITVDAPYDFKRKDADAVITNVIGVPIGILTADCMPALFHDPVKKAASAAHAGWKGTCLKICASTVVAMAEGFGSNPKDIRAAFGPFIGPCCYSVKEDVYAKFKEAFGSDADFFFSEEEGLRLDIGRANRETLLAAGLREENISESALCTACNTGLFFSYRREGASTGRQLSFIMLK